jgi:Tfp pilus assembly protein PilF
MLDEKVLESDANIFLSRSFLLQGNADMAMEMAEAAIRFDQRNQRAQAALGLARASVGDADGAERALADAVALNPADA